MNRDAEIRVLLRRGKRIRTPYFDLFLRASTTSRPRVGFVVPRYQFDLVDRNRVKRRLREAVRLEWLPRCREAAPLDALFRVHPEAYAASFATLAETVTRLAESLCSDGS